MLCNSTRSSKQQKEFWINLRNLVSAVHHIRIKSLDMVKAKVLPLLESIMINESPHKFHKIGPDVDRKSVV